MPDELLKTKLFIPSPRPNFVPRPRLIEKLTTGIQSKLTLISAPAGFGKTTLLSEGITTIKHPAGWVSLDKEDNDPTRFWTYFIRALQTVDPEIGVRALSTLGNSQLPHVESILTYLINDITEMPQDIYIVLDDYHLIGAESIHNTAVYLLEHIPSQLHLVITTRTDPPFPLSLLRSRGQLTEIRTDDLRFTLDETSSFLNKTMRLKLSEENITTLEDRTEGWIAGLQLAAISIQGRTDIAEFVHSFSGTDHYIMDYLAQEVLNRQDDQTKSFLLKTSVLERFTGPLCNAITGLSNSQEILDRLVSINLFLTPLDEEGKWFRYHHLFADLLRNLLTKTYPPITTVELHLRASVWFEDQGLLSEAINHALEANDLERAANLIEAAAMPMLENSRVSPFQGWLDRLPEEMIVAHPWLCFCCVIITLSAGKLDAGTNYLQMLELKLAEVEASNLAETIADYDAIKSLVMSIRAIMPSSSGDTIRTIELCQEAYEKSPGDNPILNCMLAFHLGIAHGIRGELPDANHYLEEAIGYGQVAGMFYIVLIAMGCIAEIQARYGHLHEALDINHKALDLSIEKGGGEPLPAASLARMNLARIHYRWNDLEAAVFHGTKSVELAEQAQESVLMLSSCLTMARIFWACGQIESMNNMLIRARQVASTSSIPMVSTFAEAWIARLSLGLGDVAATERWARSFQKDLNPGELPEFWFELPYLTYVRLMIIKGELDHIPPALKRLYQRAKIDKHVETIIEVLVLEALAFRAQGDEDRALSKLTEAIELSEPEGFVRVFVDEGERMHDLLHKIDTLGISPHYVKQLLAAFGSKVGIHTAPSTMPSMNDLLEPLTERELEVLQYAAAAMSNSEIAETLVIQESTVKSHMNHIFGKLQSKNRLQAIEKARSMGLI